MKNLKINFENKTATFTAQSGYCTATCEVYYNDIDKDNRPRLYVYNYKLNGQALDFQNSYSNFFSKNLISIIGEICDDNGWNLFSY